MTTTMDSVIDGKDVAEATQRDITYSLQWDCVVLKVENTLFKIPQKLLSTHSHSFRDLIELRSSQSTEGVSEENPIVVQDITVKEFRHFLQIILPLVTENLEAVLSQRNETNGWKDEWISVLKVSTLWEFLSLRKIAICALENSSSSFGIFSSQPPWTSATPAPLTATEKIVLGRKYSICSWVEAGYTELVKTADIPDMDMREIGPEVSFQLMRISLKNQKQPKTLSKLGRTIRETFQAELQSIAAKEVFKLEPSPVEEEAFGFESVESNVNLGSRGHRELNF